MRRRRWTRRPSSTRTQSGGTVVSTALEEMRRIIDERYPSRDWNIYAAQASDGDNVASDSERCVDAPERGDHAALPVLSPMSRSSTSAKANFPDRPTTARRCGAPIARSGRELAEFPDDPHRQAGRHLSGFPQAFRQAAGWRRADDGHAMTKATPTSHASVSRIPIGTSRHCREPTTPSRRSRSMIFISTSIPTRSRSSPPSRCSTPIPPIGMPLMYRHWSFGKHFCSRAAALPQGPARAWPTNW